MFKKIKTKNIVNLPIIEFEERDVAFFVSNSNPNKKKILDALNQTIEEIGDKNIAKLIYYHTVRYSHARMDLPLELTNDIFAGEPLKVYTSVDAPPFDYLDEYGDVSGVEIDILKYTAQKLKMPVEINVVSFKSIFTNVENKDNKFAVSGVGISKDDLKERLNKYAFSNPFWSLKLSLICTNKLIFIKSKDISGLKIAVCENEVGDIYIKQNIENGTLSPNTQVFRFENANQAFKAFIKGKVDCVVTVNYVADGLINSLRSS